MNNVREKVIELLKMPQLSSLATITLDGKPWTRYVMVQSDSDFLLRSAIRLESRKVAQIKKNPEVHINFGINDPTDLAKPYVQLQGTATITDNQDQKSAYWTDMLSAIFTGPEDPAYGIMMITPYRVEFMNPGEMTPEVWEK